MNATKDRKPKPSRTRMVFDLADELTPEELESFEKRADEAGAPNLTEHFLNVTIRNPQPPKPES